MAVSDKKRQKEIKKLEAKILPGFLGTVIEKDAQTGAMEAYSLGPYGIKHKISDDVFGFCGKYHWKFSVTLTGEIPDGTIDTVEFDTIDPVSFDQLNQLIVINGSSLLALGDDCKMKAKIVVIGMGR